MEDLVSGQTFGPYTIEGKIAAGGMGCVYAARHEVYATPVALKVLHPRLHADHSWRKRFNEEGLVGTQLKHPNVLSARELVAHDGRIALVLDLVSGGQTLDKVIGREFRDGLPLVQALKAFLLIVQGIEYLHGKRIIHGDIKPENVMLVGDYRNPDSWTPLVTDFGTVALIADPVTIEGRAAVVATPRYASPEHLLGIDQVEVRSDIYALGLVLNFMVTGTHLSAARTVEEAASQVREPIKVVGLVDQPDQLIGLIQQACEVDPNKRIATCREFALEIRGLLDDIGAPLELDDLAADLATEIDEGRAEMKASAEHGVGLVTAETEVELDEPGRVFSDPETSTPRRKSRLEPAPTIAEKAELTEPRPGPLPPTPAPAPSAKASSITVPADASEALQGTPWFVWVGVAAALGVIGTVIAMAM
ncbi:MAG: protein kinase [Rhodobacterales bacterium]|nr:protein kinase [Rhodobacterales bacterium]